MFGRMKQESIAGYEVTVILPVTYGEDGRRYPVFYVHDDGDVIHQSLNYIEHLTRSKQLRELIIVAVKPHDRRDEYTPWPAGAIFPGAAGFGGEGHSYLADMVQHIKGYVDTAYDTLPEPEHTGIGGCSFGGLISIYALYQFPHVFGKLALVSASFWYEGFIDYMRGQTITSNPQVYMYVGELEGVYKTNLQRRMVELTRQANEILGESGIEKKRLLFESDPNGTHDDLFFAPRMIRALLWLFPDDGEERA